MLHFTTLHCPLHGDTFGIKQVHQTLPTTQYKPPNLFSSNPLLSDSWPTSASWIRWIEYGSKNSRSRLSDLSDSQSNANPTTVQRWWSHLSVSCNQPANNFQLNLTSSASSQRNLRVWLFVDLLWDGEVGIVTSGSKLVSSYDEENESPDLSEELAGKKILTEIFCTST